MTHKYKYLFIVLLFAVVSSACKKQWDQRDKLADQQLNVTLLQQLQANSNLSTFAGYVVKAGYDTLLSSSKTFTVFAPTNAALQGLDAAIVNDKVQLRRFVGNHITNQSYVTTSIQGSMRVHNLNGKNLTITKTTVEEANITTANVYVNNGTLNVIDKPLTVKQNISEFIRGLTTVGLMQRDYVIRQDTSFVDSTKATVASIDPKTGKPILVAGTGIVSVNKYFNKVAALANEDSLYTYFVLTDNAYTAERSKVSKYFTSFSGSVDTTNLLAGFNVLKDVAIRGAITQANLPGTLLSVNGVNVPVDKSAIVQTYNASNGIVYVISAMNFALADKITPIVIQGENASFYSRTDQNSKIIVRSRLDDKNVPYRDLLISGSSLPAQFFAAYKLSNLYTCQYQVMIRATNDTLQTKAGKALPISERVIFGQSTATTISTGTVVATTAANSAYFTLTPYNYSEISVGALTAGTAGYSINVVNGNLNVTRNSSVNMYVQGANVTTTNGNNVLFDYIKLIPILQ